MTWDYIRQPAAIYEASFATIEAEVDLARFSTLEQRILIRMIHACGMTGLSEDVQFWGMQPLLVPPPLPLANRSLLTLKCCVMALFGHG